jgi:hypothetical protein
VSILDEECIMYVGRNRSGVDSGEIDYGILSDKFERLSVNDLEDVAAKLRLLQEKVLDQIDWLSNR